MENSEKKVFTKLTYILIIIPLVISGLIATAMIYLSLDDVKATLVAMQNNNNSELKETVDWQNDEAKDLFKKKQWLLRQLELSDDNTMSLGINLADSSFQLQLNGLVLIQTKIKYIRPTVFLDEESLNVYDKLFLQAKKIDIETASEPKRVLTKKKVVAESEETEAKSDTITQESTVVDSLSQTTKVGTVIQQQLHWEFIANNMVKFVVMGLAVGLDSLLIQPSFDKEMMASRNEAEYKAMDSLAYHPTIYLWLLNQDAKSIYRALPEKAQLVIRN
jgi:hypothetical protein